MEQNEILFPAKKPAIIEVYGHFDRDLEERVQKQVRKAFVLKGNTNLPDGLVLLIDSSGGSMRTLDTFLNRILKLKLPVMGFVENEAMSAAAELLLSCQYRVATPFAKICFHHGSSNIDTSKMIDDEVCAFLVSNRNAARKAYVDRFCKITGQSKKIAQVIYTADDTMPPARALELGIIHKITEDTYPIRWGNNES